jgi:hypothetical protein
MSGHRKAALALHGVAAEDRQHVLAGLPVPDQDILRRYLEELDALGFDNAVVNEVLVRPAPAGVRDVIRVAEPAAVHHVLASEPAALVAAVMRCDTWPWADDFLQGLAPARRLRVVNLLASSAVAVPVRDTLLLERFAAALQDAPQASPQPVPRSTLNRLTRWMATWIR